MQAFVSYSPDWHALSTWIICLPCASYIRAMDKTCVNLFGARSQIFRSIKEIICNPCKNFPYLLKPGKSQNEPKPAVTTRNQPKWPKILSNKPKRPNISKLGKFGIFYRLSFSKFGFQMYFWVFWAKQY